MDKKEKPKGYINNTTFFDLIVERKSQMKELDEGEKLPLSDILGGNIVLLGQRLLNHRNFKGYNQQVKDEMLGDGVENCLRYFDNFDPAKSKNPFAYFTQITWYAFIRRIKKEYAEQNGKTKFADFMDNDDSFTIDKQDSGMHFNNSMLDFEKNKHIDRFY